ncbi:hypothetical protein ABHV46_02255 [Asaia sp. BMEF1]|uniref:hypothetical protein n=1 Tax=Asaia sp. BMEF1 TaxID=3155932 RepID=UPI003F67485D
MNLGKLRQSVQRYQFSIRLDQLERSFVAASNPFRAEVKNVQDEHNVIQAEVDAGISSWEVPDEEGFPPYDRGEYLAERRQDAEDSLLILRKAFSTLIYHQWERSAQTWISPALSRPNHDDIVSSLKSNNITIDETGLDKLRCLANVIKHNSKQFGPKLYSLCPTLFKAKFNPHANNPHTGLPYNSLDWEENIFLNDKDVESFFATLRASSV